MERKQELNREDQGRIKRRLETKRQRYGYAHACEDLSTV